MNNIREMVISDFSDATYVENFRLFEDGTLVKRNGCTYLAKLQHPIRGMIHDTDKKIYIVSENSLYYYEDGSLNYLMQITNANFSDMQEKCFMAIFVGVLYIFGGGTVFTVNLENMYSESNPGYIPTLGSTIKAYSAEEFNLIRNRVREYFEITQSYTYELKGAVAEITYIKIDGTDLPQNQYKISYDDNGNCILTVINAHIYVGKTMELEYSVARGKYIIERENFLKCNRSFVFEASNRSYLMLYNTNQGCVYYSRAYKDEDGAVIQGDYFPYDNRFQINSGLGKIRGITQFLGHTILLTQDAMYNIVEENETDSSGNTYKTFRAVLIDDEVGASMNSGVQIFENEMFFMNSLGLYRITYNILESKYSKKRIEIPESIKLSPKELESATLHIDRIYREIWCIMENKIAVYSLTSKKWYCFSGFHPESCIVSDNHTVFLSGNALCKFDPAAIDDFGSGFESCFQTGNIDFGNIFAKKTIYGFGICFERCDGATLNCTFISDKGDTFSFSVNSDNDIGDTSPLVKRMHARLSQCSYIMCRVTSKKSDVTANVRELMFRYRLID